MIVPTLSNEVPGDFLTAALWNLAVVASANALQNPVLFKGFSTTGQSIPTGTTGIAVNLDTEEFDTDAGHSTTSLISRYVCQTPGVFACWGNATFNNVTDETTPVAATGGTRSVEIMKNGAAINGGGFQWLPSGTMNPTGTCFNYVRMAVGDYVELGVWQNMASKNIKLVTNVRLVASLMVQRVSN